MKIIFTVVLLINSCNFSQTAKPSQPSEIQNAGDVALAKINNEKQSNLKKEIELPKEIASFANKLGLKSLHKNAISSDDIELRIWHSPGSAPLFSHQIQRRNGVWSGWYYPPHQGRSPNKKPEKLPTPVSGWDNFWKEIMNQGLSELLTCEADETVSIVDGESLIFELAWEGKYKVILADEISQIPCSETVKARHIYNTILKEFGEWRGKVSTKDLAFYKIMTKMAIDTGNPNASDNFNFYAIETGSGWQSFWFIVAEPKVNLEKNKTLLYKISKDTGETTLIN